MADFDKIFADFDLDNSGEVSAGEIAAILKALGEAGCISCSADDAEVKAQKMLQIADKNSDGKLSKAEFKSLLDQVMC